MMSWLMSSPPISISHRPFHCSYSSLRVAAPSASPVFPSSGEGAATRRLQLFKFQRRSCTFSFFFPAPPPERPWGLASKLLHSSWNTGMWCLPQSFKLLFPFHSQSEWLSLIRWFQLLSPWTKSMVWPFKWQYFSVIILDEIWNSWNVCKLCQLLEVKG